MIILLKIKNGFLFTIPLILISGHTKGFFCSVKKMAKAFEFTYANPLDFNFPSNKYFIENEIKVIISFCAGHCKILEENLSRIKKELNIYMN